MPHLDLLMHLCSRLCHDIAGPISAIGNGLELLSEENDPVMQGQALQLLAESAKVAAQRLKFFRLAFGAGGSFGAEIRASEVADAAAGLFSESRAKLDWKPADGDMISKSDAKILLCLTMIAGGTLPRGGQVSVVAGKDQISVSAGGGTIRLDAPGLKEIGSSDLPTDIQSENAVSALVLELARSVGRKIRLSQLPDKLTMDVVPCH